MELLLVLGVDREIERPLVARRPRTSNGSRARSGSGASTGVSGEMGDGRTAKRASCGEPAA